MALAMISLEYIFFFFLGSKWEVSSLLVDFFGKELPIISNNEIAIIERNKGERPKNMVTRS